MRSKIYLIAFFLFSISTNVQAFDGEYWTYNGFIPIKNAFHFVALVFGTNDYKALFFAIIVAGILFGGIAGYFKLLSGAGGGSPLSWVWPIGLGILLYLAFFIPKGNLIVYDKVLNRFETISGIPDGLIVTATALNTIERGIVQIIQDSGQPLSFYDSAGGIGFNSILRMSDPLSAIGAKTKISNAKNFINDCVLFEMTRPGTVLTSAEIDQTTKLLIDIFAEAKNDAVWTSIILSDGSIESVSCTDAYAYVVQDWSATASEKDIKGICSSQGFDTTNASDLTRCKEIITNTISVSMGNGSLDAGKYFTQASLASILNASAASGNLDGSIVKQADINTKSSMMSVGLVANEYLPVMRAVITAIAIGMVPFIVIFLPTSLGTKAIGFVIGFFVWLTCWGITDAITHQLAMDYANIYFEQARLNNIGYSAMMAIPDAASRTLGLFGMIRTSGVMLATVITTTLMKFGGHVMGQMAGQFSGTVQGAGSHASQFATAEGTASRMTQLSSSVATMDNAGRYNYSDRTGAETFKGASGISSALTQMEKLPGGAGGAGMATGAMAGQSAVGNTRGMQKQNADYGNDNKQIDMASTNQAYRAEVAAIASKQEIGGLGDVRKDAAGRAGVASGSAGASRTEMSEAGSKYFSKLLGRDFSQQEYKNWEGGGKQLSGEMADGLNKRYGITSDLNKFEQGMSVDGMSFNLDKDGNADNLVASGKTKSDIKYADQDGQKYNIRAGANKTVFGVDGGSARTKGTIHDMSVKDHTDGHDATVYSDNRQMGLHTTGESGHNMKHAAVQMEDKGNEQTYRNDKGGVTMHNKQSGDKQEAYDVNTSTVSHGLKFDSSTMSQQVQDKQAGAAMFKQIDGIADKNQRQGAVTAWSKTASDGMKGVVGRTAADFDRSELSGSAGAGLDKGIKLQGGGSMSVGGIDQSVRDKIARGYENTYHRSHAEAENMYSGVSDKNERAQKIAGHEQQEVAKYQDALTTWAETRNTSGDGAGVVPGKIGAAIDLVKNAMSDDPKPSPYAGGDMSHPPSAEQHSDFQDNQNSKKAQQEALAQRVHDLSS